MVGAAAGRDHRPGPAAGEAVTVSVLSSAFSPAGGTLSVASVTQGAHGTAAINADGTVTYTPAAGYAGPDSFQYTVTDGNGNTATGTISLTVGPAPAAPEDAIDSDLAGIETDLENPDDNTADTVSSIWSASISGAMDAYLNNATEFINTMNLSSLGANQNLPDFAHAVQLPFFSTQRMFLDTERMKSTLSLVGAANKQLIDYLTQQFDTAKKAKPPNRALLTELASEIKTLSSIQVAIIKSRVDLQATSIKLNKQLVTEWNMMRRALGNSWTVPYPHVPSALSTDDFDALIPKAWPK